MEGDFPFYLEIEAREEHSKIERGIRKSFDKLLNFQKYIKRRSLSDFKLDKLLFEINEYMKNTNALWTKTCEIGIDDYDFYVFTLVSRAKFVESQRSRNDRIQPYNIRQGQARPICLAQPSKKEVTRFFRPWN